MQSFTAIRKALYINNLIGPYNILVTGPSNLAWFIKLFLAGRHAWSGRKTMYIPTNDGQGHMTGPAISCKSEAKLNNNAVCGSYVKHILRSG